MTKKQKEMLDYFTEQLKENQSIQVSTIIEPDGKLEIRAMKVLDEQKEMLDYFTEQLKEDQSIQVITSIEPDGKLEIRAMKGPEIVIDSNLEYQVVKIISEIGVPTNIKGYTYIKEAIILMVAYDYKNRPIKELYDAIAKKYSATFSRVERAIRHAIETVWQKEKTEKNEEIFGDMVLGRKLKPTNVQFLIKLYDYISLKVL